MNAPTAVASPLLLRKLEIRGFRAFDHLSIPRLGRVNVFVGPNSMGKTTLLEAIRLLASSGAPATIVDLLTARDELSARTLGLSEEDVELLNPALRNLFHRSSGGDTLAQSLEIGVMEDEGPHVSVERGFIVRDRMEEPPRFVPVLGNVDLLGGPRRALRVVSGSRERIVPLPGFASLAREVPWEELASCLYVSAHGLAPAQVAELWDRIALTEREEAVLQMLRLIAPVERLSLIGDFDGRGERKPFVKIPGSRTPLSLGSLGDGMNRLLGLALALVNAEGGVVLIDEVENGLHYGVQDEVWRTIFALAARFSVQVFATTHSWDTVVGFQYAANLSEEEGMLYRLELERDGRSRAVAYTEEEVEIAAEQRIEVR